MNLKTQTCSLRSKRYILDTRNTIELPLPQEIRDKWLKVRCLASELSNLASVKALLGEHLKPKNMFTEALKSDWMGQRRAGTLVLQTEEPGLRKKNQFELGERPLKLREHTMLA